MTADTVGGVWTYALELARALPEVEFALATMGAPVSDAQRFEAGELGNVTLFASSYALEWMDEPWADVDRAGEWLLDIGAEFHPDVVHLNGYSHAALPWEQPVVVVAHSCVLSWWSAVRREPPPARYDEYRRRVSASLHAADAGVAPTRAMLESLRPNYEFFAPGEVIANARLPESFPPAAKEPRIFAAGRMWDEAKNLAALEAVAPHVRWPIEIAGETAHPNGGVVAAQHVNCLGKLSASDLAHHLGTSAIYALPARYEPFGLSALEAALAGCALVLGDISSLREVWGDAAVFVPPDDHAALAASLNSLIDDAPAREHLANRARARALEFSPRRMAKDYLSLYRKLLARDAAEVAA